MTIIVTGGAGFIGSNFVFHMLKKYPDYRIVCLDKLTYAGNLSTLAPVMDNPNFRFVKEDICDREAVYKLFEEEHPDIVFLDIVMPVKDGNAAIREIREYDPTAEIIIVSSVGTQAQLKAAIESGAKDFIQKPMNPNQIASIISSRFEGR